MGFEVVPPPSTDIVVSSLAWTDNPQGGADFSYQVANAPLTQSSEIDLYWAKGPNVSDIIAPSGAAGSLGTPIPGFSQVVSPEPAGTYGPIHVPQSVLAPPPIAATDLLVVADPKNVVEPSDPDKVMALARGPEVVNVVTHGFNPYESWAEFLQPWDLLQTELDGPANTGPALAGRVATYRPQWDSTGGWAGELVSTIASYLLPAPYSSLARVTSALFAAQAAALAEEAAEDIDQYITDPANGYLTAPGAGQVIDLIGHSRGAAVNARVSQLLKAQGYNVAQYISLDGYSTDWPPPSNTFGDISIVGTATATRKVNYEVEQGLGSEAGHAGYSALLSLLGDITGKSLASDEINQLLNVALNWQAPDRAGFENYVIPGSHVSGDPNYWSNHTDITSLYSVLGYGYIKNLYDWIYANVPGGSQASQAAPALASVSPAGPNYSDFRDASFDSLGSFLSQVQAANINPGDSTVLAAWLGMVDNPAGLLASTWDVAGDARLAQGGGNTLALLSLAKGTASVGQYLELDPNASTVGFDLTTLSAKAGDQLQLLFGGNVVSTWNLSSLSMNSHLTASIAKYASQNGEMTLQLVGPSGDAVKVGLDNLSVLDTTATTAGPATFSPVRGQPLTIFAVVSAAPGQRTPTGTVTFMNGSTVLGTAPVLSAGGQTYAQLTTSPLAMGAYTITTVYSGDADDLGSTASTTFTVGKDATTTVAGPATFTPVRGQALTVFAVVAPKAPGSGTPTGTVTFKYGSTVLATVPVVTAGGQTYAQWTSAPLGLGTYTITTTYNGDAGDATSSSTTRFTVGPDATSTVAGPSIFAPKAGQAVSLNAIVFVKAPGAGTPTGTVTFNYGGKFFGTATLKTVNGLTYATLPLAPLGAGTYTFTAVYNGDAGDRTSLGSTTFTVAPAATKGASPALAVAAAPVRVATMAVPAGPATGFVTAWMPAASWKKVGQGSPNRVWLTVGDSG